MSNTAHSPSDGVPMTSEENQESFEIFEKAKLYTDLDIESSFAQLRATPCEAHGDMTQPPETEAPREILNITDGEQVKKVSDTLNHIILKNLPSNKVDQVTKVSDFVYLERSCVADFTIISIGYFNLPFVECEGSLGAISWA